MLVEKMYILFEKVPLRPIIGLGMRNSFGDRIQGLTHASKMLLS